MRLGLIISISLHALVLGWGLISLSAPAPYEANIDEALPVSFLPIAEESETVQGELTAPMAEQPSPRPSDTPQQQPDATRIGNETYDTQAPPMPGEKPSQTETSSATTAPAEQPAQQIIPSPTNEDNSLQTPPEEPQPTVSQPPQPPEPEQPAEDVAPQIAPEPQPADDPAPQPEQPQEPVIPALPQNVPVPAAKPATQRPQPTQTAAAPSQQQSIEDILGSNETVNLNRQRSEGGGGARAETSEPASLGGQETTGQSLVNSKLGIIQACLRRNFRDNNAGLFPQARIIFKFQVSNQATIIGTPEITIANVDSATIRDSLIFSGRNAVARCQPFDLQGLSNSQMNLLRDGFVIQFEPGASQ